MQFRIFSPTENIRSIIKQYQVMEGVCESDKREGNIIPSRCTIEIIFHLGAPLFSFQNDEWMPERNTFIKGLQTGYLKMKLTPEGKDNRHYLISMSECFFCLGCPP